MTTSRSGTDERRVPEEQRLRHEMKQASAVLCMFLLTQLNSLPPFSTRATSFLVLTFAGCCPFLAHLQSIYPEASLELLTVDIRAKCTQKPNYPLRLPVPARCSFTITINLGGHDTSNLPANPTRSQVMRPNTTLYAR